jgi:hypothetical protein
MINLDKKPNINLGWRMGVYMTVLVCFWKGVFLCRLLLIICKQDHKYKSSDIFISYNVHMNSMAWGGGRWGGGGLNY